MRPPHSISSEEVYFSKFSSYIFRDVFVRSVVPGPIWLVLVLDQSEVSKTRMLLGQRVARLLLASLSEKDRVALVLASDTARVATTAGASQLHLLPASHETKLVKTRENFNSDFIGGFLTFFVCFFFLKFIGKHIYGWRGSSSVTKTNHTRALLEAFRILRNAIDAQKNNRPEGRELGLPTGGCRKNKEFSNFPGIRSFAGVFVLFQTI